MSKSKKRLSFRSLSRLLRPPVLIGAGVMLCIVLGSIFAVTQITAYRQHQQEDHARQTARQLITALNAGDMHAAYQLTSQKTKSKMTQTEFSDIFNDLHAAQPRLANESIKLKDKDATYTVTIDGLTNTRSGIKKATFTIGLTGAGDTWQVSSIKTSR